MKALLIVVFAVYVVTTVGSSLEIFNVESAVDINIALNENQNLAKLQDFASEDDKSPLEQCTEKTKGVFSFYDYSVVIAMLCVSLKIGVFYGYFHKSSLDSADFMLGSKMGLFPVTLSLATRYLFIVYLKICVIKATSIFLFVSSFVTAIELLGNPAEMFFHGTQFSLIGEF